MSSEKSNQHSYNDEIDLSNFIKSILRYKYSIIIITIFTTFVAFGVSYYIPDTYKSKATVEIGINEKTQNFSGDILAEAISGVSGSSDIDTQIAIIKSRFIVLDAMRGVDVVTNIYGVNKFYKKVVLYKDSPIKINLLQGVNLVYELIPINDKKFNLKVEYKDLKTNKDIKYQTIKKYGEKIKGKDFELTITKTGKPFIYNKYIFKVENPYYKAEDIRKNNISVSQVGKKANILEISYEDKSALRSKDFVNSLAKAYMDQNIKLKTQEAIQTLEFINKQLMVIQKGLKESENKLQKFKMENKTIDVTQSAEKISDMLAEYENKLGILDMKIGIIQNLYQNIKRGKNLEALTLAGADLENSGLSQLIAELQQALLKQKDLLRDYTYAHPEVKKVTSRINSLKRIIKESVNNVLRSMQKKRALIRARISKLQKKLETLPKVQKNYLELERSFAFNEKFYSYLLEKRTETEIKKAATVSQNRIIDLALLPQKPIKPKRKLILLIGVFGGLILGILFALIRNMFDNKIINEDELKELTDAPIVGIIPKYKTKNNERKLIVLEKPKSSVTESFRNLRTNLQFMLPEKNKESVVISLTSTIANEGKSSISLNLGAIYAMLNKKVIIVDLDLRKVHNLFKEYEGIRGASEFLSGHLNIEDAIKKSKVKNLDIIPSGSIPPNPSELLASKKTKDLINILKNSYDVIIIDTAPIGLVTDARMILSISDIVLYILRSNYSKKDFVKTIKALYNSKDIKSFGIVLNSIDAQSVGYGYGYGYYEDK